MLEKQLVSIDLKKKQLRSNAASGAVGTPPPRALDCALARSMVACTAHAHAHTYADALCARRVHTP